MIPWIRIYMKRSDELFMNHSNWCNNTGADYAAFNHT